jgi:hypothetical protein
MLQASFTLPRLSVVGVPMMNVFHSANKPMNQAIPLGMWNSNGGTCNSGRQRWMYLVLLCVHNITSSMAETEDEYRWRKNDEAVLGVVGNPQHTCPKFFQISKLKSRNEIGSLF